ncbi:MAG: GNAT family N-acetyltransferase [Eubacterium sp.]|nr:GNAT family N-acetyltransferase [Eubacterium sp.]
MIKLFEDYRNPLFENVKVLRQKVFVDEQGADKSAVFDDADTEKGTMFALAFDGDCAVATGRLVRTEKGYKIGRVAVLSSKRGKGTGKALIEFLCNTADENGAQEIRVDSQLHAVPFYNKLGFEATGEDEKLDIGLTHKPMRKE